MRIETNTYRFEIDERFSGSLCKHEYGSVWDPEADRSVQLPILNFALSEIGDLTELYGEGPYEEVLHRYFDAKRTDATGAQDTLETIAGRTAHVRRSTSGEVFHLFVNIPLDDEFMHEFSADCALEVRELYEPLFLAAMESTIWEGDRRAAIDEQDRVFDALIARIETPAPPPVEVVAPLPPFDPSTGEQILLGDLDPTLVSATWSVTNSGQLHLTITLHAEHPHPDVLSEYGNGTITIQGSLIGAYVPVAFDLVDNRCQAPYLNLSLDGLDYRLAVTGRLTVADGWVELRGRLGCSYKPELDIDLHLQVRPTPERIDWTPYRFTTLEELRAAPPEEVRHISLTGLAAFPEEVLACTRLESFSLAYRNWKETPPLEIPPALGSLTTLTSLHISGYAIPSLPESLGELRSLTRLALDSCGLTALPTGVWDLPQLQYLSLPKNALATLPEVTLPSLTYINLQNNALTTLPASLLASPLRQLDLTDNPWESLDELWLERGAKLDLSDRQRLFDFSYRGADGSGTIAWKDSSFQAQSDPTIMAQVDDLLLDPDAAPHTTWLRPLIKRALFLQATRVVDAVGAHRFGGMPDLPEGVAYPRYGQRSESTHTDYAYEFIAQLNCEELAPMQAYLPRTGTLYFFLTTVHDLYGGAKAPAKVLYTDGTVPLVPAASLRLEREDYFEMRGPAYAVHGVAARVGPSAPSFYALHQNPHLVGDDEALLEEHDLFECLDEVFEPLREATPHTHAVNAYAFTQHESPEHAAAVALRGAAEDWVILLTVASHGDFQWGDAGELFFVIHKSDLAKGDFSNVFCTMESS